MSNAAKSWMKSHGAFLKVPRDMPASERKIWREVVENNDPSMFGADCIEMLRAYCHASAQLRKLRKVIDQAEHIGDVDDLTMKAHFQYSGDVQKFARLLRLAPSARVSSGGAKLARDSFGEQQEIPGSWVEQKTETVQ